MTIFWIKKFDSKFFEINMFFIVLMWTSIVWRTSIVGIIRHGLQRFTMRSTRQWNFLVERFMVVPNLAPFGRISPSITSSPKSVSKERLQSIFAKHKPCPVEITFGILFPFLVKERFKLIFFETNQRPIIEGKEHTQLRKQFRLRKWSLINISKTWPSLSLFKHTEPTHEPYILSPADQECLKERKYWCFLVSSICTFLAGIFAILLFRAIAFIFQSSSGQNQQIGQQQEKQQQANTNGHVAGANQFGQLNATQQNLALQNQPNQQKLKPGNFGSPPPPQGKLMSLPLACWRLMMPNDKTDEWSQIIGTRPKAAL